MTYRSQHSRRAKVLRCREINNLASIAHSFLMAAITPVNTGDTYECTNFVSASGPQTLPDCPSVGAGGRVSTDQHSLSAA